MSACAHTMLATDAEGVNRCCDCGRVRSRPTKAHAMTPPAPEDIVGRLTRRRWLEQPGGVTALTTDPLQREAADEITSLRADKAELEEALQAAQRMAADNYDRWIRDRDRFRKEQADRIRIERAMGAPLASLSEALGKAKAERDEAKQDADELRDRVSDLECAPWPKWATDCLAAIRAESGYDGYDDVANGVDLPAELDDLIGELHRRLARAQAAEHGLAQAREALKPFAAITPSSFYPSNGSEREGYVVVLAGTREEPEFTGADLARARTVFALENANDCD